MTLMQLAKGEGITVFVIGHVNKEGSIAGPKVLEHMVDCVLYFEGEQHNSYRILRAAKNRFGATNEIGVFDMGDNGLEEVPNPSETLLSGRPQDTPGTCVTCVMEGVRPVLAEVQALLAPSNFGNPRRASNGFDFNRAMMLLAVLEKRGGLLLATVMPILMLSEVCFWMNPRPIWPCLSLWRPAFVTGLYPEIWPRLGK